MEKPKKLALQESNCRGSSACRLRRKPVGKLGHVAFLGPGPPYPQPSYLLSRLGFRTQAVFLQAPTLETPAISAKGRPLKPSAWGAAKRVWTRGAGRGRGTAEGRGGEGVARAPIGRRGVPRPFMAAGPGHRSKTKGRRPAGRRQEDASRGAGAPTAGTRSGPHRDRLKAESAPTEPGPDGRYGPGRGPPSGREYGRAPGGCSAAT